MLFSLYCLDKPGAGQVRASTRPAHLAFLRAHDDQIVVAGPILGEDGAPMGSLLVMDFPDQSSAEAFCAEDPYARAGLFDSVTVRPFRRVFPE